MSRHILETAGCLIILWDVTWVPPIGLKVCQNFLFSPQSIHFHTNKPYWGKRKVHFSPGSTGTATVSRVKGLFTMSLDLAAKLSALKVSK